MLHAKVELKEAEIAKRVLRKTVGKKVLKGVLITAAAFVVLIAGYVFFFQVPVISIPAKDVVVEKLVEQDNTLFVEFLFKNQGTVGGYSFTWLPINDTESCIVISGNRTRIHIGDWRSDAEFRLIDPDTGNPVTKITFDGMANEDRLVIWEAAK